jgi:hypothetical protein
MLNRRPISSSPSRKIDASQPYDSPGYNGWSTDLRSNDVGDTSGDTGDRSPTTSDECTEFLALSTRRDGRVVDGGGLENH